MAAINFPSSPTLNDEVILNGKTWIFNGKGWAPLGVIAPQGPAGPKGDTGDTGLTGPVGAASTIPGPKGDTGDMGPVSTTPGPQGPKGDPGIDGINGTVGADGSVDYDYTDTAPVSPVAGTRWFDTSSGLEYVWYIDTDGGQWVSISGVSMTSSLADMGIQVNSDWNATSGVTQIQNKPDLSVFATTVYVNTQIGDIQTILNSVLGV